MSRTGEHNSYQYETSGGSMFCDGNPYVIELSVDMDSFHELALASLGRVVNLSQNDEIIEAA